MDDLKQMRMPDEFLKQITGNFSTRIGRGGSGVVYKGQGIDYQEFAVKVLDYSDRVRHEDDLHKFLMVLAKVKHPNIIQFLGYGRKLTKTIAWHKQKSIFDHTVHLALCFEYMHNGNLHGYLYDEDHGLGWHERYRIIKGICEGLKYLHMNSETPVHHLALYPANILLDKNMVPKIADFGLHILGGLKTTITSPGSLEHFPPESIRSGAVSIKYDIFSLGVIIIKIMVGHKGYSLVSEMGPDSFSDHVFNKWRTRLQATPGYTTLDTDCQQVKKCIDVALRCISEDTDKRPATGDIVEQLNQTEKHKNDSAFWIEEVVRTSQGLSTETVHDDSSYMELNILEHIVNESEKPSPLDFTLLHSITENFSEKNKIGSGGCGSVYKGILRNGVVAVKKLHNSQTITNKMFHREVISLISVKHENIVRFLGYCSFTKEHAVPYEGITIMADIRERLLCYEYIRNGSLDKHLSDELRGLEWQTRYQIIIGICRGLHYLHKDKETIHMDLKPGNILLDDLMVPKITDFGLSRPENDSKSRTTRFISRGYAAPEYISGGKATSKSDIYSLGIIIIELVTGSRKKPNISKVIRRWNHRWIKSTKQSSLPYQQVQKCLELALRCIKDDPKNRPDISCIKDELEEIDATDGQTQIQMEDILGIEPLEIRIPFEDFKISHSIELTNDTDDYIAFVTKAELERFCTEPDKGIIPPRSKRGVTVAMQEQVNAQPNVHYTEVITVLSTRVDGGALAATDITVGDIFNDSKEGNVVDEVNVMVVVGKPELPEE